MISKILILVLFVTINNSNSMNHEAKLHAYLFTSDNTSTFTYNPNVRPLRDSSKKVDIQVRLGIKRIFEMNEMNHQVTIFAILIKKWKDEFLTWNPKNFGDITHTYVEYRKIWSPQFTLISKYTDDQSNPSDNSVHKIYEKFPVKLSSNGDVEFIPSLHLQSECLFNYRLFPFEFQLCDFHFQMPYNKKQVNLRMASFYTQEYHKYEPIWSIENINQIDTLDSGRDPLSILRIQFKRTTKGHTYTLPSYVVYTLTLLMFLLPQQSNQRLIIGSTSFVISTLLSYMLSTSLPHDDISAWPILGKLYLFNTLLLTFSLLFSAFIINISNSEHAKSVPDWLKKFTVNFLAKMFCVQAVAYTVFNSYNFKVHDEENAEQINNMLEMSSMDENLRVRFKKNDSAQEDTADIETTSNTNEPNMSFKKYNKYGLSKILKSIHDHVNQIRDHMQIVTYKKCATNEWLLVAILFDKIFFFIYCFIVVFVTTMIFKK